ncbi:hypothetical protein DUNSADRAFT_14459 [Dunaliella salina]|uniref:Encoded protein n=1 Tax=Dunaliella salina TaxID=3046 RepID=A0ABQ7H9K9_DUNSA|nr:hypothetical protein DUNSADRAFT_14459 [Dunaliella salina]|eukprot:KAF5843543.1 hypothetical protein DUNSADRAFT_14459 [Dunaliella salina]
MQAARVALHPQAATSPIMPALFLLPPTPSPEATISSPRLGSPASIPHHSGPATSPRVASALNPDPTKFQHPPSWQHQSNASLTSIPRSSGGELGGASEHSSSSYAGRMLRQMSARSQHPPLSTTGSGHLGVGTQQYQPLNAAGSSHLGVGAQQHLPLGTVGSGYLGAGAQQHPPLGTVGSGNLGSGAQRQRSLNTPGSGYLGAEARQHPPLGTVGSGNLGAGAQQQQSLTAAGSGHPLVGGLQHRRSNSLGAAAAAAAAVSLPGGKGARGFNKAHSMGSPSVLQVKEEGVDRREEVEEEGADEEEADLGFYGGPPDHTSFGRTQQGLEQDEDAAAGNAPAQLQPPSAAVRHGGAATEGVVA